MWALGSGQDITAPARMLLPPLQTHHSPTSLIPVGEASPGEVRSRAQAWLLGVGPEELSMLELPSGCRPRVPRIQYIGHGLSHTRETVGFSIEQYGVIVRLPARASTDQIEKGRPKWRQRCFPFSLPPFFLPFFLFSPNDQPRGLRKKTTGKSSNFSEPKNHWGT